ncbi:MAG: hypothetical protein Fur0039_15730 [Rhodocyclaceae bacterium]
MCGIAGVVGYGDSAPPADAHALARMAARMAARGPDGAGEWLSPDGRTGLGHRRLAIIDLTPAGAQPMLDPATGNVVVFNGEIYNYRELKRELEAAGCRFRSDSDTEVLLHLYARHGEAMVGRLGGMFAFALWDASRHRLFLARDPLGIKPLYYADDGRTFRFASQVKALLAGGVSDAPDSAGLAGFFLWGHVPEPWTWVAGIRALPAGCTLTIEQGAPVPAPRRYFDLREEILAAEQSAPPAGDAVQEALEAVRDSVRRHLVADVPVGAFLSAGRDSTLIAALAARELTEPLRTVTLGFDEYRDTVNDELPVAERVAAAIAARHETHRIRREDFEAELPRILEAMDQPSIDGVNTYFVAKAARAAGIKVALSGLGGDELFGGYPSFVQVPRLARRLRLFARMPAAGRAFRVAAAPLVRRLTHPKWASLAEYGGTLAGAWLLRRALYLPWEIASLLPPALAPEGLAALDVEADLAARIAGIRNPQLAVMALEMSGYMRNQLLRDADWAGMAHSLEIRVPLVDARLLRRWLPLAAHRFPLDRQRLLEAADARVAGTVGARPKSGFSVPVAQWLAPASGRTQGEPGLRPWARRVSVRFNETVTSDRRASGRLSNANQTPIDQPTANRLSSKKIKILIYRYGQLGDTLVAIPAVRAVREQFRDAHITWLCDKHPNANFILVPDVIPPTLVDQILAYEADAAGIHLRSALSLLFRLRAERFDMLVYLVPRQRGRIAVWRDRVFFTLAGIKQIVGHRGIVPLDAKKTHLRPLPMVEHEAENLLARLRLCGIGRGLSSPGMTLTLSAAERAEAERWLLGNRNWTPEHCLVAICAGSKAPCKRWPEERFAELGKRLMQELGVTPVVVGGAEERPLGERLIATWGGGFNAAGQLSIRGSAALLERCRLYVGNDTGVMHLGAAVGTPCVAIFAAQDWPGRWNPYGTGHIVLRKRPPCEGCKLIVCREHDMRCLREISVEEVFTACAGVLAGSQVLRSSARW